MSADRSVPAFSCCPREFALDGAGVGSSTDYERRMAAAVAAYFKTIRTAANDLTDEQILRGEGIPWAEAQEQLFRDWEGIARDVGTSTAAAEVAALGGEAILLDNPYVERWLQTHGAEMVTGVSAKTQDAIRAAIRDGVLQHNTVRETARNLRSVVGLRDDQMRAVDALAQRLIAQGVEGDALGDKLARYARQKVAERALLISRTETMQALNQGKDSAWRQARDSGIVLPQTQRIWIGNAGARRTCDICRGFIGKTAPIDGEFKGDDGDVKQGPPAHPACRCTTGLQTLRKSARRFWGMRWTPSRL